MSDWAGIKKAINSDLSKPLNTLMGEYDTRMRHMIWLNDYKTFGEDSYVFQNKDILHELYRDYELCMNDESIISEATDYANSIGEVGKAFAKCYGIEQSEALESSATFDDVFGNADVLSILGNNETALRCLISNEQHIAKSTYMTAMTTNPSIIKGFAKSTADWETKKPFVVGINSLVAYCKNVFTILSNTEHFTAKVKNVYQDAGTAYDDKLLRIAQYGTSAYASNGIIACRLSSNTDVSVSTSYGSSLYINKELIKTVTNLAYTSSVTSKSINAVAIPTADFKSVARGRVMLSVYIAN